MKYGKVQKDGLLLVLKACLYRGSQWFLEDENSMPLKVTPGHPGFGFVEMSGLHVVLWEKVIVEIGSR